MMSELHVSWLDPCWGCSSGPELMWKGSGESQIQAVYAYEKEKPNVLRKKWFQEFRSANAGKVAMTQDEFLQICCCLQRVNLVRPRPRRWREQDRMGDLEDDFVTVVSQTHPSDYVHEIFCQIMEVFQQWFPWTGRVGGFHSTARYNIRRVNYGKKSWKDHFEGH